ncbi:unnamed protein product, partial [Cuscuta epithymum]
MGSDNVFTFPATLICVILLLSPPKLAECQKLDDHFYDQSCPHLHMIVSSGVWSAIKQDPRMAASLLRLHFHDCFVNGCDGSVLLDDTTNMKGEKNAPPNRNSLRGFEVIDSIKADLEKACPSTVSCADILTLAAVNAVSMLIVLPPSLETIRDEYMGGRSEMWSAPLGRRDGLTASEAATKSLPSPLESFQDIKTKFLAQGLDTKDMVVLS